MEQRQFYISSTLVSDLNNIIMESTHPRFTLNQLSNVLKALSNLEEVKPEEEKPEKKGK